jgi:hypothetical protein
VTKVGQNRNGTGAAATIKIEGYDYPVTVDVNWVKSAD